MGTLFTRPAMQTGSAVSSERLDKFISSLTPLSRSMARRAILAGEVSVNGQILRDAAAKVSATDLVRYRNDPLEAPAPRYLMLHKPVGVICATEDGSHRTVIDLLTEPWRFALHVAGRLDIDTTGLVLLTDDGDWSHRVTSPRHKQPKQYHVTTADRIDPAWRQPFAEGLLLQGEDKPTLPAELDILDDHHANLTLHEGRYHQVKRMFAAMGTRVTALHRYAIGSLTLDADLPPGAYRTLTPEEVASLRGGRP